jgi:hypothetical protein
MSRPLIESGPANTCAPKLSQYRPRDSDLIRPPTRGPASSTTMSPSRSSQAAARPAIPAPTMTTSRCSELEGGMEALVDRRVH